MARGGAVKRTHTISVRVTPGERAAWDAVRAESGRKEMGAWVRDVVSDALEASSRGAGEEEGSVVAAGPRGRVPGGRRVVPEVNRDAYRQLVGAAANLNQITRAIHTPQTRVLIGEVREAIAAVTAAARTVQGR